MNYIQDLNDLNFLNFSSNLLVLLLNARSISSMDKFNNLKSILFTFLKRPSIIIIGETWFGENLVNMYNIPGYKAYHSCRRDCYGGLSIYVLDHILVCRSVIINESYCNIVNLDLDIRIENKPLSIIGFYRSQKCPTNDFF